MESKSSNLDLATREKLIEYLLHQSTALDKGARPSRRSFSGLLKVGGHKR